MKNYVVYFKGVLDPVSFECESFEVESKFISLSVESQKWFKVHGNKRYPDSTQPSVFLQYSEVAAIIPAEYDPAHPGFAVYLKGQPAPLIVKAHDLEVRHDGTTLLFLRIKTIQIDPEGRQLGYEIIDDIYVSTPEVLAVLPEDVTEGEADAGEDVT